MAALPYNSAMTSPPGQVPVIRADLAPADSAGAAVRRTASAALLLGTVFWGCGFTWAKAAGETINARAVGLPAHSAFGPVFLLSWRFLIGGVAWMLLFPASRRGWTWAGAARSALVGILLALGLIVQHVGLDRTSEAVSAFLTSLTILFVPILTTFGLGKRPRAPLWIGVALATGGVWLMTGASPSGFGAGELLGLACALAFSFYILTVNAVVARDVPWRVTGGQFLAVAGACFVCCAFIPGGRANLSPHAAGRLLAAPTVWINLLLLTAFPTIAAYGLLTHYQPKLDPTRAALLYLMEPVVAAIYAAVVGRHPCGLHVVAGGACILLANALAEVLSSRAPNGGSGNDPTNPTVGIKVT